MSYIVSTSILGIQTFYPTFSHDGDASTRRHTHDHTAWSDIRSGRRPRAHTCTPADAPPAQHHAMLRARCQLHSLLATVQCAVAAADHNCCNTAFHYTTQHTSELRRRIRRADTIASAHDSPRGAFRCSSPHCLPFCSAQRSPCCSACCEDCCTAAPSRRPSSSARLPSTVSSSNATCDAATSLPPTTCAPADRPQHQRLAPHYPQHLPSCSATACGTSEWTIFPGTTSARDFKYECHVSRRAPLASYDLRASRPSTTSTACSSRYPQHPSPCSASARRAREPRRGPTSARRVQAVARVGHTKTPETHGLSG